MKTLAIAFAFFATVAFADPINDTDHFRKELVQSATGPTGYLTVQSMVILKPGQTAVLVTDSDKSKIKWSNGKPSSKAAQIKFDGKAATLSGPGISADDLLAAKDKHFQFPNGLIARASLLNEHAAKIWLHDPEMIRAKDFKGLNFFNYDDKGVIKATFEKLEKPEGTRYVDSQKESGTMYIVGHVTFDIAGKTYHLKAYSYKSSWDKVEEPMIFIVDGLAAKSTYAGGRVVELKVDKSKSKSEIAINFNSTYAFLCAHSHFFNCPVGLTERIDADLPYGEKLN